MLVLAFFGLHTSFFVPVVVIVSLLGLPIVAKHYECDWDPLAGRMPWEAGFKQLCASFPVLHGAPPIAYFCDVEGAAGYGDYIVAGWGTRDGELEFGGSSDVDALEASCFVSDSTSRTPFRTATVQHLTSPCLRGTAWNMSISLVASL